MHCGGVAAFFLRKFAGAETKSLKRQDHLVIVVLYLSIVIHLAKVPFDSYYFNVCYSNQMW